MDMEQILSNIPTIQDKTTKDAPAEAPAPEAAPETPPRPQSRRAAHRDREMGERGLVRNPETGQFAPKEAEAAPKEVKEEPKAEVKDEPKAEPKVEVKAEPKAEPRQEFTEREKAFLKAAEDERRKRQELERQFAARAAPQPTAAPQTFWDDPETALKTFEGRIVETVQRNRLAISEANARSRYPDCDEKIAVFMKMTEVDPLLRQQCLNSPDPADYAYRVAKNHMDVQKAGGVDKLVQKVEAETRAKVEAEVREKIKKEEEARKKQAAELPPSLTEVQSAPSPKRVWGGPTPLDNILKK